MIAIWNWITRTHWVPVTYLDDAPSKLRAVWYFVVTGGRNVYDDIEIGRVVVGRAAPLWSDASDSKDGGESEGDFYDGSSASLPATHPESSPPRGMGDASTDGGDSDADAETQRTEWTRESTLDVVSRATSWRVAVRPELLSYKLREIPRFPAPKFCAWDDILDPSCDSETRSRAMIAIWNWITRTHWVPVTYLDDAPSKLRAVWYFVVTGGRNVYDDIEIGRVVVGRAAPLWSDASDSKDGGESEGDFYDGSSASLPATHPESSPPREMGDASTDGADSDTGATTKRISTMPTVDPERVPLLLGYAPRPVAQ